MSSKSAGGRVSLRAYIVTYASLLVLATLSWLIADLRLPGELLWAIAIAALKAVLVLGYFMHLAEEAFSFKLAIATAVTMVAIFISLTVLDPLTRTADARIAPQPAPSLAAAQRSR